MKKILTREEIEKRRKRNVMIMSTIMLAILVLSTAGYGFLYAGDTNSQSNPNNQNLDNRFGADVYGRQLYFNYYPEDTNIVSVVGAYNLNDYIGKILYVASENPVVINEITSTLGEVSGRVQRACYGRCDEDLPEKNCDDNLIIWKDSNENKVYKENNCVFIEGDLRAVDAFLFKVFDLS